MKVRVHVGEGGGLLDFSKNKKGGYGYGYILLSKKRREAKPPSPFDSDAYENYM